MTLELPAAVDTGLVRKLADGALILLHRSVERELTARGWVRRDENWVRSE